MYRKKMYLLNVKVYWVERNDTELKVSFYESVIIRYMLFK